MEGGKKERTPQMRSVFLKNLDFSPRGGLEPVEIETRITSHPVQKSPSTLGMELSQFPRLTGPD